MSRRPLGDHHVPGLGEHGHPVGVEKLPVPLANLAKLELEVPVLVEDLDPTMVFRLLVTVFTINNPTYLWLLVSATMISLSSVTATPLGSVNCPSRIPNSPNLQW